METTGQTTREGRPKAGGEARERLAEAVEHLVGQDEWLRWLDTRARFHSYSFADTLLIAWQRPDATQVAGYKKWQELGRQVRYKEHGIAIFAPSVRRVKDENGDPTDETELRFRTVKVFDVSQTDGEALPEPPVRVLEGDSGLTDLADTLTGHVLAEGLELERGEVPGGANGRLDRRARNIKIASGLGRDASLKTLIHELAHWHDLGPADETGYGTCDRSEAEIVAESVAYVVAATVGLDTSDYSVGYVASWADGDVEKIRGLADRVDKAARPLLDLIDTDLGEPAAEVAA